MKEDVVFRSIVLTTTAIVIFTMGCVVGIISGKNAEREKAVKANAGYYTCDGKTGDTTFVYGVEQ
jgi:hypothetical protein